MYESVSTSLINTLSTFRKASFPSNSFIIFENGLFKDKIMIIVTVKSNPKLEFKNEFLREFNYVAKLVREETGCIEYGIYQKNMESSDLFIFERWESRQALNAHLQTEHMAHFFEKTGSWFETEKELNVYEVSE